MAFPKRPRRRNNPSRRSGSPGFSEGLNTLAHPSTLKDSELSEFINGIYSQYGSVSKRLGTTIIGEEAPDATAINTLQQVRVGGVYYNFRIANNGKPEVYSFSNRSWSYFSGTEPVGYTGANDFDSGVPIFNTTVKTHIKLLDQRIYFLNSIDEMMYWEAGQWYVYEALVNPSAHPTVAKTGSATGSTTWFYYITFSNDVGGTIPTPSADPTVQASGTGWIGNMPQVLDDDTYLTVTFPTKPSGTRRINIFRSNIEGIGFYLASVDPSETAYVDKGQDNEDTFFGLPTVNSSGGKKFKLVDVFQDKLIGVVSDADFADADSYLYWAGPSSVSTTGSPSFDPEFGGGYQPYKPGDGTSIRGVHAFISSNESSLLVFKDSSFGRLTFISESGATGAQIQDINIAIGTLSPESLHIAGNNFRFWSRDGAGSVGHEANYGNLLRYSVLSLRADGITRQITANNLPDVCGVYYRNLSIFAISTQSTPGNNACLVYDERYNSWAVWTGIYVKTFAKMVSTVDGVERLYYGSNLTADVLEMFSGKTDYGTTGNNGNKITLSITTKQYDFKLPDKFKRYDKVVFVFGSLFGNNTTVGVTYSDAKGVHVLPRMRLDMETNSIGFGSNSWGELVFGESDDVATASDNSIPRYINLKQKDMFWAKFNIQNDGIADEISIIGIYIYYTESNRQLGHSLRIKRLA